MKSIYWLLIIFVIAVVILYYFFFYLPAQQEVDTGENVSETKLEEPVNLNVLNDEQFQDMNVYSDLPVSPGETGNENPFKY